jgi:PAS domain S-box-containing protein
LNDSLSATLRAIPDLLFEINEAGTYVNIWANRKDLLAANEAALLGRSVREMLPSDASAEVMASIREAAGKGYSYGRIIRLVLDGKEHWFELSTSSKTDEHASEKRFIMLSRDITERRQAEESLRRLNEELEQRVKERTAELENMNAELKRVNKIFIGRELKMAELKKRVRELEAEQQGGEIS